MLRPREWKQIESTLLRRELLVNSVLLKPTLEAHVMHTDPIEFNRLVGEPPRRTYMARIEDYFKRDYGPHSQEAIVEETGFSNDVVRTSLHALKRHGVVVLLRSVAGSNLWLYNPRGDKRRYHNQYRMKETSRNRGREQIVYVDERKSDTA